MAIDFGLKRVGLAVTDPLQLIAQGLTTVETPKAMDFILNYCREEEVETIVLGMPLNFDGSRTDATEGVEKFMSRLQKKLPGMPIELEDERLSSKMAKAAMLEGGMKKKRRRDKKMVDKISATLILQSFLESK
jgi:putative Holliday junction resolvase